MYFLFFILGYFFPLNPHPHPTPTPLAAQKIKIKKKMKNMPGDITTLQMCTENYDHMIYTVPVKWCTKDGWTDRQMDGRMDEVTYKGECPT